MLVGGAAADGEQDDPFFQQLFKTVYTPVTNFIAAFQAKYDTLPFAAHISAPMLMVSVITGSFFLWLITKLLDDKPYLYNNGKLGSLEKKSTFVCPKSGNYVPPKKSSN